MKINVFEDSPSKTAFFSAENSAENQNPPLYESNKVIIRGGSTLVLIADEWISHDGREGKTSLECKNTSCFACFLGFTGIVIWSRKMVVLRPRGNADLGLQIGPGTREKEIEFERERERERERYPAAKRHALRLHLLVM